MYIESVPNRNSPPAILLRESYREDGKVKKRTLANLSKWPPALVENLRILLKGGTAVAQFGDAFDLQRSRPHGAVAAVLGSLEHLGLDQFIDPQRSPERDRALALIVAQVLEPDSELASAQRLAEDTALDSLGETLELGALDEDDLGAAMDWLLERQPRIEQELARRHLQDGALALYGLTSTCLKKRERPVAQPGDSRDARKSKMQIKSGLLRNAEGCPVAVEAFPGNTGKPAAVETQIKQLRARLGLSKVALVGDRGTLTETRIRQEIEPAGLDWISALRSPAVRELVASGAVRSSLFSEQNLIEIRHPDYPGERLMACRNPQRTAETALNGLCVIRTSLPEVELDAAGTVRAYKRLNSAKRGFRSLKTVLKAHPASGRSVERIRAHALLCMLAYHVEWHMRQRLAPLLIADGASARRKARRKRNAGGYPAHSFRTLLGGLTTLMKNRVQPCLPGPAPFDVFTQPTELQREAFRLLGLQLP